MVISVVAGPIFVAEESNYRTLDIKTKVMHILGLGTNSKAFALKCRSQECWQARL